MTHRAERRQRQREFGRAQSAAILRAITATAPTPEVERRICDLAATGMREADIGARLGVGVELVRRAIGERNAERP